MRVHWVVAILPFVTWCAVTCLDSEGSGDEESETATITTTTTNDEPSGNVDSQIAKILERLGEEDKKIDQLAAKEAEASKRDRQERRSEMRDMTKVSSVQVFYKKPVYKKPGLESPKTKESGGLHSFTLGNLSYMKT